MMSGLTGDGTTDDLQKAAAPAMVRLRRALQAVGEIAARRGRGQRLEEAGFAGVPEVAREVIEAERGDQRERRVMRLAQTRPARTASGTRSSSA